MKNLRPQHFVYYILLSLITIMLSSCGFRPMYSYDNDESKVANSLLTKIKIKNIKDREGQLLKFNLEELFDPYAENNEEQAKEFELKVKLNISKKILSLRKDSTLRRQEIHINAKCNLFDITNIENNNKPIYSFDVNVDVPYSISSETNYKSLSAIETEESSMKRGIAMVAEKINTLIRIKFIDRELNDNKNVKVTDKKETSV